MLLVLILIVLAGGRLLPFRARDEEAPLPAELQASDQAPKAAIGTSPGDRTPDFSLPDLDGNAVSLRGTTAENSVTLLNFWATWCPPCRAEIPDFVSFYQEFAEQGVAILGVNIQEPKQRVQDFAHQAGITYPVLLDVQGSVAQEYRVRAIPTTYVLDKEGIIQHVVTGILTEDDLRAFVQPLLQ